MEEIPLAGEKERAETEAGKRLTREKRRSRADMEAVDIKNMFSRYLCKREERQRAGQQCNQKSNKLDIYGSSLKTKLLSVHRKNFTHKMYLQGKISRHTGRD